MDTNFCKIKNKSPLKYLRGFLLISSALIAFASIPKMSVAAQGNAVSQDLNVSSEKSITWTNQDTGRSIEIPSGWTISMSLKNNRIFTLFHDDMSGAEITIYHEDTTDDVETYSVDALKVYSQQHIKINDSHFSKVDEVTFWFVDGEIENDPSERFTSVIHKKDEHMWVVAANFPLWTLQGGKNRGINTLLGAISWTVL